jgi:flagellar assembly protein FliH
VGEAAAWEFVDPTSDFFKIPEQQIWQEKFAAEKERVELIRQARAEAQNILLQAHVEADQLIQNAQADIEQSKRDGYEAARDELQSALAATRAIIEETHQWQTALMQNSEQTLMDMLKDIAQTIFGEGVRLDPNALQINLNRIMDSAQRLGDLKIFLNPRDANELDPSWSNYQLLITGNKVRIVPSEKIKPGGCVIKGSTGTVDARVETQLNAVLTAIDEVNEVSQ